jgi:alpha(1,3/1,4) fucosyltransferase
MCAQSAGKPTARQQGDVAVYFDPPVHQLFRNKLFERGGNPYAGDNILAPFVAIHDRLTKNGIAAQTLDLLPERPDERRNIVISFGPPDRLVAFTARKYRALARRADVVMSAFFAMECPVVEPKLYKALPAFQRRFRRIMSWSDTESLLPFTHSRVQVEHFCWPQSFDAVHDQLWSQGDRKFLLMMNSNKLPRLYVNELYTARLRAVEFFHAHGEIDLYGRNWDRMPARVGKTLTPYALRRLVGRVWPVKQRLWPDPLYTAAASATLGPALSKSATLAQYRFALCFENSILKGWMTEKLFDCFFAGTVPVYWGAPDVLDWVPAECFIDMRQFKDFSELRSFLHALTPADERRYREAARDYLVSDQFTPFRVGTFVDLVMRIISADTGIAL